MAHKVAILGGGVGGLTVAHELKRVAGDKVDVTVYERNPVVGGKARSMAKKTEGPGKDLPGEHGFRFFPGYYQHVIRTMEQVPYPIGSATGTVVDNLVEARVTAFARTTGNVLELPNRFPHSIHEMVELFTFGGKVRIPMHKAVGFARALRNFMCACDERRLAEFETQSWFDFCGAEPGDAETGKGSNFKKYLADGLNQRTVAASGKDVSARTVALTLVRIMNDWLTLGKCIDRVLDGPTSERWLEPWHAHLEDLGVTFELGATLVAMTHDGAGVQSATVRHADGTTEPILADSYVAALPLADAREVFVASGMAIEATGLAGLAATDVPLKDDWMNGIQLYFDAPLGMAPGHTIYVDSQLSLTSISQGEFWADIDLAQYGDGSVRGVLSVDISDWNTTCSDSGRTAKQMTREEIKDEVLEQVRAHVTSTYGPLPNLVDWHLDPSITELDAPLPDGCRLANSAGLFINTTSSWDRRPVPVLREAGGLANLYIASDYAQTTTDLATMEGANEAGRRAARGVLEQMGEADSVVSAVELFDFPEPDMLQHHRLEDKAAWDAAQVELGDGDEVGGYMMGGDGPVVPPMDVANLPEEW